MKVYFNKNKTLTELENDDWGEANSDSYIEKGCYELRYKPLCQLEPEGLRLLIGQGIGLKYLMPIAVNLLENEPLTEGMHYKGDLLYNVLLVGPEFYKNNINLKKSVMALIPNAVEEMRSLDEVDYECTSEALEEAIKVFKE